MAVRSTDSSRQFSSNHVRTDAVSDDEGKNVEGTAMTASEKIL